MEHQYVAFSSQDIQTLVKIMKLVIESDHDTVTLQMPADHDGYSPKLEITIIP